MKSLTDADLAGLLAQIEADIKIVPRFELSAELRERLYVINARGPRGGEDLSEFDEFDKWNTKLNALTNRRSLIQQEISHREETRRNQDQIWRAKQKEIACKSRDTETSEETREEWKKLEAEGVPEHKRAAEIALRRRISRSTIDKQILKLQLRKKKNRH